MESVKLHSKQKEEFRQTIFDTITYIVNLFSLFYITLHILPPCKFLIDNNFRSNLNFADEKQINDTWPFLTNELLPFIHLKHQYNGEKVSVEDRKYNSDMTYFRLGPALLYQFRGYCDNYKPGWKSKYTVAPSLEYESAILSPWLKMLSAKVPGDWESKTGISSVGCGYRAEIGSSIQSGTFILDYLQQHAWLW